MAKICVTGSEGLIGRALVSEIRNRGFETIKLDLKVSSENHSAADVTNPFVVNQLINDCQGIIHLAAVSRVAWAENDAACCQKTNVHGTHNVVEGAFASPQRPWILFASSREVYGRAANFPVAESEPLRPMNVYGRSKLAGERIVESARARGLATAIVRLSNVYGSTHDHVDRVVPAFARAAASGTPMHLHGSDCTFDFTHLDDVICGLLIAVEALQAGEKQLPALHLVTGRQTSLGELAALANKAAERSSPIITLPPRNYDVEYFVGDPTRAAHVLGWRAQLSIREGVTKLVKEFQRGIACDSNVSTTHDDTTGCAATGECAHRR